MKQPPSLAKHLLRSFLLQKLFITPVFPGRRYRLMMYSTLISCRRMLLYLPGPAKLCLGHNNQQEQKRLIAWAFIMVKERGWSANIFAKVFDEDVELLIIPGNEIWKRVHMN
ncbi:MAG: hypothetical protein ABI402_17410 [Ferruginibacter sp.]